LRSAAVDVFERLFVVPGESVERAEVAVTGIGVWRDAGANEHDGFGCFQPIEMHQGDALGIESLRPLR
jgi:hypothetical protein